MQRAPGAPAPRRRSRLRHREGRVSCTNLTLVGLEVSIVPGSVRTVAVPGTDEPVRLGAIGAAPANFLEREAKELLDFGYRVASFPTVAT
ncbi:MAG: hypothetical protein ABFC89_02565 [Methanospirillum sp.]